MSEAIAGIGKYVAVRGWTEANCAVSGPPEGCKVACDNKGAITLPK